MGDTPRIGSLFSGYGGLEMGVQLAIGGTVAWHVEVDPAPSSILAHHWPDVPNLGDVTKVDWGAVERVDVLTGGFPCQDVSHAGRRAGLIRGENRTGLWAHMLTAIDVLRPSLVVAENVRGLLSAKADSNMEQCPWCMGEANRRGHPVRALGAVLGDLADVGYDAVWYGLRAADVGAPHARFRVFIVAHPAGRPWRVRHGDDVPVGCDPFEFEPYTGGGVVADTGDGVLGVVRGGVTVPPSGGEWGNTGTGGRFADRHGGAPSPPGVGNLGSGMAGQVPGVVRLLPTPMTVNRTSRRAQTGRPTSGPSRGGPSYGLEDVLVPVVMAASGGAGACCEGDGPAGEVWLLPTPAAADGQGGRTSRSGARIGELLLNGIVTRDVFGEYAPAVSRWASVLGVPAPPPTEPTGRGGAHRLSPVFVEWMMGLPAGHVTDPAIWVAHRELLGPAGRRFTASTARNAQLRALGNGVVPLQAAVAVTHLLELVASVDGLDGVVAA